MPPPAFLPVRTLPLPLPQRARPCHLPPTCNTAPAPRATRLSLPTYRERRYLQENYVEREKGRATCFARATAFTLMAWPLVVRELTGDEVARRRRWVRRQRKETAAAAAGVAAVSGEELSDGGLSDGGCDMVLAVSHDSVLLDTPEFEEESLLAEAARFAFEIPPWAYVVRVRAGKPALGKRAVQRNRAKRRIRAAAASLCPDHARRGFEYVFTAQPEVLTVSYADLVEEVRMALKKAGCWVEEMTLAELTRERYCKR